MASIAPPQLKARCEELKLDWSTLSLESLLKEKQALKSQISEKQRHCLELQVGRARALGFRGLQGCSQCPRHTCRGHPPEDSVLVLGVTVTAPRASPSSGLEECYECGGQGALSGRLGLQSAPGAS